MLSRRNALDQAIEKYKVQQADHMRICTELEVAKARMSETLHAPATGPVIGPQFQDLSVHGEDSDPGEGDADMEDVVQPEEHQTSEQMFSHVDHEDYVSCGAPSNQIAILRRRQPTVPSVTTSLSFSFMFVDRAVRVGKNESMSDAQQPSQCISLADALAHGVQNALAVREEVRTSRTTSVRGLACGPGLEAKEPPR